MSNEEGGQLERLPHPAAAAVAQNSGNTLAGVVGVLETDPFYFRRFRLNRLKGRIEVDGRPKSDIDEVQIAVDLERRYDLKVTTRKVYEAIAWVAEAHAFDPLRDYLGGLVWDGVERIDQLLPHYFKTEDTPLTRAYGRRWLIGGVRRAMEPGAKMDSMLILQGEQGARKSSGLSALCADPSWFCDAPLALGGKEQSEQIQGVWIKEIAELQGIRGRHANEVKSYLSMRVDRWRPAYGRNVVERPRTVIFAATTNEDGILVDDTGSRRFWPSTVTGKVDTEAIERDRDQLWAEAFAAWKAGEQSWLTEEEEAHRVEASSEYEQDDSWIPIVAQWLDGRVTRFTLADVFDGALDMEPSKQRRADQLRLGGVLRSLGCTSDRRWINGSRTRGWNPPKGGAH